MKAKRFRKGEGGGGTLLKACAGCRFPDAPPVGLNAEGAVTFDELPPAPPAPDTIGVLDEKEKESPWNEPDPPRWGRRPMPEHIPTEEEMEAWDTKMAVPDTWLDRAINGVMGSLFGGGDDKVDSD
ncbi:expressed unknown protein [Ectocarpus siliculosus]|uniref:Uncharacterized protein n=1 Tax=Ectocarpus siliculosus TaxID=2880 RepID=D7FHC5_ECTSI|nr:expressed unknown protein [Ectocarpus siliculosus]|eukprot:CBJ28492.1 expressed unknown protein [Ectocarpus siliculosus]